jgi:S-adenosyl-L-methionine hydrolase (adenosine-forming)
METNPIVTLTTDFGTQDGYVGAMIGVILSHAPHAQVHHITHDVPPMDVASGGWALMNAWQWFPSGTIHVVVVDPGVGTDRRGIVVSAGGHVFIGPDNGVIPFAIGDRDIDALYEIANADAMAPDINPTFHGRDVFSWCAGWIIAGNEPSGAGPQLGTASVVEVSKETLKIRHDGGIRIITGCILACDRFGNLITTIRSEMLPEPVGSPDIRVDGMIVAFARTFGDVPPGDPVAYVGSGGYVEVAVNGDSAESRYGRNPEIEIKITPR